MATSKDLKNQLTEQSNQVVDASKLGFKTLMSTPAMKKKFTDILHEKSDAFMGSLLTLVGGDDYLSKAEPMTIIASALKAATMDLPIDKNLGYAYIVPFNRKEKVGKDWITHNEAQFILGYKGYIQLAQRSGQYKALNAIEIYEGQLIEWNPLTEEFQFDYNAKQSDRVIGYVGFFELLNGFKKTVYWTKQEVEAHRIKHVKGFDKTKLTGAWKENYDAMAIKTVLRNMLAKWGILSVEMQNAVTSDERVFRFDENNDLVEEVTLNDAEPIEPELKEAEKVEDVSSAFDEYEETANIDEQQDSLFDDMNPPL
ncbi:recombinase RecT [Enterococcus hirae]|uniref:recombinase RecT n=3 Tax=Enterococcus hirae TaxID=1354 RepID=UPI0009BEB820|nr:recombinase RecT [Enterococcus hirae]OWW67348.1 phage RecT family recombinase [Enterococcus hirae 57-09-G6]EMF0120908.1 recombinase RecT [Enterococcus hirae]EMF0221659.1 recombinase RecT [Enterococcus hirae]EMF0235291.1 recombinase RecT [Enterococcus hirae]EMF0272693.1 recombinase RecT [Enterococcus hirae]